MRRSYLFFAAAILFAVACGLNLWNEGAVTIRSVAGIVFGSAMLFMGLQMRRQGK